MSSQHIAGYTVATQSMLWNSLKIDALEGTCEIKPSITAGFGNRQINIERLKEETSRRQVFHGWG